jgi:hypothetical protein
MKESAAAFKPPAALPSSSASSSSEARKKEADVLVPPVKFGVASPLRSTLPDKAPGTVFLYIFIEN